MALSEKHRIVADEYLRCFNRRQAYRAAYPDTSDTVASSNSWRLWQNPEMQGYISKRLTETAMSADEVLMRLAEEARAEYAKYIVASPRLDMVRMAQDGKADLIPQIVDEHGNIDVLKLAMTGQIADVAGYILQAGYVDIAAMDRDGKKHLIKSIKPTQYGMAIEFHDAQAAKLQIGKYHKLFTDQSEVKHSGTIQLEYVNDWRSADG